MSDERDASPNLEDTLVEWINTFEGLSKHCASFSDLSDGIVFGEVLSQISPAHLDSGSIKHEALSNDFLKLSNVRLVVSALEAFYSEEAGLGGQVLIDATAIAADADRQQIENTARLLLGMLVETKDNARFVQNIMKLSPSHQAHIMRLIQQITSHNSQQRSLHQRSLSTDDDEFFKELDAKAQQEPGGDELGIDETAADKPAAAADAELGLLRLEHDELLAETGRMRQERDELQRMLKSVERELSDERKANAQLKAQQQHEHQLASPPAAPLRSLLVDESDWAEQRANMERELEDKNVQITELKKKIDDLSALASEARSIRDSIDIYKERAAMAETLEERLKKLQLKADSVGELKKQIKALEQQNDGYMKQIIELDEAAKKAQALKPQLDKYKELLTAVQADKAALMATLDEKDGEIVRAREAHSQLRIEHRQLAQQLERLERKQGLESQLLSGSPAADRTDELAAEQPVADSLLDMSTREKLHRLELDNQRLRAAASDSSRQELEDKLDDATRLNSKYALDIQALQRRLKDADAGGTSAASSTAAAELQAKLTALEAEHNRTTLELHSLQAKMKAAADIMHSFIHSCIQACMRSFLLLRCVCCPWLSSSRCLVSCCCCCC
eukprot:TRINITY_DN7318_c0_g1_i1.p1 TRINITY_DN7318_c0_g1~~TRINITY_DN7318_c0_g1_i1.p1  ORF type:complete len:622 (+),score=295.88 TRINITY_DN7318_c0_g1_i1:156-2021(+)